jgi:hypothetical protein
MVRKTETAAVASPVAGEVVDTSPSFLDRVNAVKDQHPIAFKAAKAVGIAAGVGVLAGIAIGIAKGTSNILTS